jgi:hypothetical protein
MRGISRLAENRLTSQEGLCSMELVINVYVLDHGNGKVQFGNHWPRAVGPTVAVLCRIIFVASIKVVSVDVKHVSVSESSLTCLSVTFCYLTSFEDRQYPQTVDRTYQTVFKISYRMIREQTGLLECKVHTAFPKQPVETVLILFSGVRKVKVKLNLQ